MRLIAGLCSISPEFLSPVSANPSKPSSRGGGHLAFRSGFLKESLAITFSLCTTLSYRRSIAELLLSLIICWDPARASYQSLMTYIAILHLAEIWTAYVSTERIRWSYRDGSVIALKPPSFRANLKELWASAKTVYRLPTFQVILTQVRNWVSSEATRLPRQSGFGQEVVVEGGPLLEGFYTSSCCKGEIIANIMQMHGGFHFRGLGLVLLVSFSRQSNPAFAFGEQAVGPLRSK
jgi:hypothetical protein